METFKLSIRMGKHGDLSDFECYIADVRNCWSPGVLDFQHYARCLILWVVAAFHFSQHLIIFNCKSIIFEQCEYCMPQIDNKNVEYSKNSWLETLAESSEGTFYFLDFEKCLWD